MADHMVASGMRKGTRIVATGRYIQRDYQTEAGDRRSIYELNVDDLGASVRYATVQITKATGAFPQQPQAGMTEGGDGLAGRSGSGFRESDRTDDLNRGKTPFPFPGRAFF